MPARHRSDQPHTGGSDADSDTNSRDRLGGSLGERQRDRVERKLAALGELPVTWASRTERADGKTSPEELIAAAHASCFAMALSLMLGENRTPPERLAIEAACTLDEVDGAPRITTVALTIRALVPGLEQARFEQAVERAAGLCPVSNALRGNVEISVQSELAP